MLRTHSLRGWLGDPARHKKENRKGASLSCLPRPGVLWAQVLPDTQGLEPPVVSEGPWAPLPASSEPSSAPHLASSWQPPGSGLAPAPPGRGALQGEKQPRMGTVPWSWEGSLCPSRLRNPGRGLYKMKVARLRSAATPQWWGCADPFDVPKLTQSTQAPSGGGHSMATG